LAYIAFVSQVHLVSVRPVFFVLQLIAVSLKRLKQIMAHAAPLDLDALAAIAPAPASAPELTPAPAPEAIFRYRFSVLFLAYNL